MQYNAKDSSVKLVYEPQPRPRAIATFSEKTVVKVACGTNHTGSFLALSLKFVYLIMHPCSKLISFFCFFSLSDPCVQLLLIQMVLFTRKRLPSSQFLVNQLHILSYLLASPDNIISSYKYDLSM